MNNGSLVNLAPIAILAIVIGGCATTSTPQTAGTFFVTSKGGGNGADFAGLGGADKHCQTLAAAAGLGNKTWRAYLSTQASGSTVAVNAKDRIGTGPWRNVKGVVIATNVSELHGDNNITKQTALTERGTVVAGRGEPGTQHDILTGTQRDGTAYATNDDKTCGNWTKSGSDGSAIVGHSDRNGNDPPPDGPSWNSSHATRGCSDPGLVSTGGAGYLYCFAVK